MTTINTVNIESSHVLLLYWIVDRSHAGIVPGVFSSVKHENIFTGDLKPTKVIVGELNTWWCNVKAKYSLAVINPEGLVERQRSSWIHLGRSLKPAELSAILESPLSDVFVDVECSISYDGSVIFVNRYS